MVKHPESKGKLVVTWIVIACVVIMVLAVLIKNIISSQNITDSKIVSGLICNENTHDFGSMTSQEATQRVHSFVLTNTSKHPIKILKQVTTCGCTAAELTADTVVASGETLKVPVKADWANRAGPQSAVVNILTDDERTPTISLTVSGVVKVPVILTPSAINFGLLKPGQSATRVVKLLQGTDPKPFELTSIEVASKNVSIARIADKPGGDSRPLLENSTGSFAVKITAPRTGGRERTRILFKTNLDERPELWLDVKAQFQDVFVANPKSVLFSDSGNTAIFSREVEICPVDKHVHFDPKVKLIWEKNEINPFSVEEITESKKTNNSTIVLSVRFDKIKAKQIISRAILRVSHENDSLDIPIMAIVKSKK